MYCLFVFLLFDIHSDWALIQRNARNWENIIKRKRVQR
jgi:hypothetical protein